MFVTNRIFAGISLWGAAIVALALLAGLTFVTAAPAAADVPETQIVSGTAYNGSLSGPVLANTVVWISIVSTLDDNHGGTESRIIFEASQTTSLTGTFNFAGVPSNLPTRVYDPVTDSTTRYTYSYNMSSSRSQDGILPALNVQFTPSLFLKIVVPLGATISGRVIAAATHLPIGGIVVRAASGVESTTDPNGYYIFSGMAARSYTVSVEPGFQFNNEPDIVVAVSSGQVVDDVNFEMAKLSTVSGVVRSKETAAAVSGVEVSSPGYRSVTTDDMGYYSLPAAPSGTAVSLKFVDPAGIYTWYAAKPVVLVGDVNLTVDAELIVGARIAGTIRSNGKNPQTLPKARISVFALGESNAVATAVADAGGNYVVHALQAGTYSLSFAGPPNIHGYIPQWWGGGATAESAQPIVLAGGQAKTGIDATLDTALTLAAISGTVTFAGLPASSAPPGADVELTRSDGLYLHTETDASGSYALPGVPSGQYGVKFTPKSADYAPVWWMQASTEAQSSLLTIDPSASLANINAVLPKKRVFVTAPTPVITGLPQVGATLTAVTGTWFPTPDSFAYSWLRNGAEISGATRSIYTVTDADLGASVSVRVQASKDVSLHESATSTPTAIVKYVVGPAPTPVVSGAAIVGQKLTTNVGAWGPASVILTYTWKRDSVIIPGASSPTYVVTTDDVGKRLAVSVVGHADGYAPKSMTSLATLRVVKPFAIVGKASISGAAVVGKRLTVMTGIWSPTASVFTYQWMRNGAMIPRANSSTYNLTSADAGTRIGVKVTAGVAGYATRSVTSPVTTAVLRVLTSTPTPEIIGTATLDKTLFVTTPAWKPGIVGLAYQWSRNGVKISGATSTSYKVVPADVGKKLTVGVTGIKSGYASTTKTSKATAVVTAKTMAVKTPTITGIATVGRTLKAVPGTWGPAPVTLKYQWKRNGIAIAGATSTTYKLVSKDNGAYITVAVTGTKVGYRPVVKTSAAKHPS